MHQPITEVANVGTAVGKVAGWWHSQTNTKGVKVTEESSAVETSTPANGSTFAISDIDFKPLASLFVIL